MTLLRVSLEDDMKMGNQYRTTITPAMDEPYPPLRTRPKSQIIVPILNLPPTSSPNSLQPIASGSRRHSMNPPDRRPLRSSPLAGPALSGEGSLNDEDDEGNLKPKLLRIASNPDITSFLSVPSSSTLSRRPSSLEGPVPALAPQEVLIATASQTPDAPSRRASFLGLDRNKSKRKKKGAVEVPPVPSPPIPLWALKELSPNHVPGNSPTVHPAEPSTLTRNRTQSRRTLVDPMINLFPHPPDHPQTQSREPSENWLTTNTYDVTPRFSRLSLASTNVVLPISAREHKRLSRASSRTSLSSSVSHSGSNPTHRSRSRPASFIGTFAGLSEDSPVPGSQSLPSLTLTRTRSDGSSKEGSSKGSSSRESEQHSPPRGLGPRLTTSSLNDFGILLKSVEEETVMSKGGPLRNRTDSIKGTGVERRGSFVSLREGMRNMSIRSVKSKSDFRSPPAGKSFLSFGSDKPQDVKLPGAASGGLKLEVRLEHEVVAVAPGERATEKKRTDTLQRGSKPGTVRRLWRTLSTVGRRRAAAA